MSGVWGALLGVNRVREGRGGCGRWLVVKQVARSPGGLNASGPGIVPDEEGSK